MDRRGFVQAAAAAAGLVVVRPRGPVIPETAPPVAGMVGVIYATLDDGREIRTTCPVSATPLPKGGGLTITTSAPPVRLPVPRDRAYTITGYRGEVEGFLPPSYPPLPLRFEAPTVTVQPGDDCSFAWPVVTLAWD